MTSKPARVRFAPSPTGHLHIGGARTALYDYLLARQSGGQFILRLEDTDRKRFVPGAEQELVDGLRWLGIEWDEGIHVGGPHKPYRQSERKEIYQEHAKRLIESGNAYYCFCTPQRLSDLRQSLQKQKLPPRYDGHCRILDPDEAYKRISKGEKAVIRFKTPKLGTINAVDNIRGPITVENRTLDDYILVKSDGLALYHLAAIVDDHLMGITHVIRGSEWIPTFPLHVHLYNSFEWDQPEWVHLSLFLKPSGKGKMSKRDSDQMKTSGHSIFVKDLERMGYLPEAVVNWIALMGWSFDDHTEFFTMDELIEKFDLTRLNPSPAAINVSKFDHFNGLHIRSLEPHSLAKRIQPFFQSSGYQVSENQLLDIVPIIQTRLTTLDESVRISGFFFEDHVAPEPNELIGKKMTQSESINALHRTHETLSSLKIWISDEIEMPMRNLADGLGLKAGQLFGIIRVAITGQQVSPPLFESMEIVGKDKSLERIQIAIDLLRSL